MIYLLFLFSFWFQCRFFHCLSQYFPSTLRYPPFTLWSPELNSIRGPGAFFDITIRFVFPRLITSPLLSFSSFLNWVSINWFFICICYQHHGIFIFQAVNITSFTFSDTHVTLPYSENISGDITQPCLTSLLIACHSISSLCMFSYARLPCPV